MALLELAARELQRTKAAAARSRQVAEAKEAELEGARAELAAARAEVIAVREQAEASKAEAASAWNAAQQRESETAAGIACSQDVETTGASALEAERAAFARREAELQDAVRQLAAEREEEEAVHEANAAAWRSERDEAQVEAAEARERESEALEREREATGAAHAMQLALEGGTLDSSLG